MASSFFVCDENSLSGLISQYQKMCVDLEDAYNLSKALKSKIESSESWEGKSKEEFLCFLDIVLQYHGKISNGSGSTPIRQADKALKDLLKNSSAFSSNSQAMKNLKSVKE